MTWDEDGDGIVDPPEKVALLMDMAWPDSTDEGKVLSLFRSANADVGAPKAREAINPKGGGLDDVIDASLDTIVAFAQAKAKETAIEAHGEEEGGQRSDVASPAIDLVKAVVVGQKWADAAIIIPVAEIATEVFADNKHAPLAKEAVKQTKRYLEASARAAASPIAAACDYTNNEYVCDMNSCINVGFDVGTNIAKGGALGGVPGAVVGAGLALAKTAFSGDLKACANGIIKVGGKLVKLAEKFIPAPARVAVEKTVTAIKKTPVFKIAKRIVTTPTVRAAARYAYNGIKNYVAPLARHVEDFGRSTYNSVSRAYTSAKNKVSQMYNTAKNKVSQMYNTAKSKVSQAYNTAKSKVSQAYNTAKSKVSQAYNTIKSKTSQMYNTVKSKVSQAYNTAKSKACELTGWCRRRRWRRDTPALEYNTSDVDPMLIDPMLELLADAGMLA
eukprot:gene29293-31347_t